MIRREGSGAAVEEFEGSSENERKEETGLMNGLRTKVSTALDGKPE